MISTHTPKMFDARIKSDGINAKIQGSVPLSTICSKTTTQRKELWAAPRNAAEMKMWRETLANLPADYTHKASLPNITDPFLKQVLLPLDWRNGSYVSATPLASMGVLHELFKRIGELNLPYKKWVVQPNPAAMANHGEALLLQGGAVRMLRRGPAKITQGDWRGDFIQLTARCESMNVSSGMMATGFPAMTAIGGFIHSLERKIGHDIEFAFGMKSASWIHGVRRIAVNRNSTNSSPGGRLGGKIRPVPGFVVDEMVANCEIVLLLKTKAEPEALQSLLKKAHKLAGGCLFDVDVSAVSNDAPTNASYFVDASADIARKIRKPGVDNLQAALEMYAADGQWVDDEWLQPRNGYTLNHTGYALLEKPVNRSGSRDNYPHAWAESTFSLITQGSMTENCWWSRAYDDSGVFWKGSANG